MQYFPSVPVSDVRQWEGDKSGLSDSLSEALVAGHETLQLHDHTAVAEA